MSSKTFLLHEMLVSCLLMFTGMFFSSAGAFLVYVEDFVVGFREYIFLNFFACNPK